MLKRILTMAVMLLAAFQRRQTHLDALKDYQIQMMRERIKGNIIPSPVERETILALAAKVNHDVEGHIVVVTMNTYKHWLKDAAAGKEPGQVGRKPTKGEAKELVLEMKSRNSSWGYSRIHGELRKLGHKIGRMTVKRILEREGQLDPPKPDKGPWKKSVIPWTQYIAMHAESLLACDFFRKKGITSGKLRTFEKG